MYLLLSKAGGWMRTIDPAILVKDMLYSAPAAEVGHW